MRGTCSVCRREIRDIEQRRAQTIESEYRDAQGRCFDCSKKKKGERR